MISLTPICAAVGACLWYSGTSLEGFHGERGGKSPAISMAQLTRQEPRAFWEKQLLISGAAVEGSTDSKVVSDHAAVLVRLGRLDEAITLLTDVEKRSPGNYFVAANLGTALELKGDLDGALQWIQEEIRAWFKSRQP